MEDQPQGVPVDENDEQFDLESAKEAEARANLALPAHTRTAQALRRLELSTLPTSMKTL